MLSFAYKRFGEVVPEPGALDDEDQALLEKVEAGSRRWASSITAASSALR